MKNFIEKSKRILGMDNILTPVDRYIILALSLVFALLVFFRLGNMYAPQTTYQTSHENPDIIIDFGDYETVYNLHIFLGNLDNRHMSLSVFNEITQEWEIINNDVNVSSVFQWNRVEINYKVRYLGIVCQDREAVYNEFVFTGPNGIITPVNISEYPNLFDEQEYFFTTAEKTYMDGTMFDEIYHGRTGYEFVHSLPTYETTHPQLGKCLIALGIKIFGMTPFGFRFMVAIFGILFIPLMYIFAKRMFKSTFCAFVSGMLIAFDCMHYTLSRISTIDIFVAFFIILCYYFMYKYIEFDDEYRKNPNLSDKFMPRQNFIALASSGLAMGMAISTKLTGVYAAVGLAVIFLFHTIKKWPKGQVLRLLGFCVAFFIVIPLVIYILPYSFTVEANAQPGYGDMTISFDKDTGLYIGYGHTGLLAKTLRNTNYMINYHKNLVATHYYATPFYEWPIMWMPLLAANDTVNSLGQVSSVTYIGNPAVFWIGFICVFPVFFFAIFKKDRNARFLSVAYLAQYVPWFFVSRITFIYHYLPSAIFSMLMIVFCVDKLIKWKPAFKKVTCFYLIAVVILFFIFFPVISGYPVSREYGMSLRWLPEWILVL